jgi:hypothetical protein
MAADLTFGFDTDTAKFRHERFHEILGKHIYASICSRFKALLGSDEFDYVILKVRKTWSVFSALKPNFLIREGEKEIHYCVDAKKDDGQYILPEVEVKLEAEKLRYILNDRVLDAYINDIKKSLDSGKKILLVDDCTNTGSTVSDTVRELNKKYEIPYEKMKFFSFYINADMCRDYGDNAPDLNCYIENNAIHFLKERGLKVGEKKNYTKISLFLPNSINYKAVSDVRYISNSLLKAIHEAVSPYVSYLPCYFMSKNENNAKLYDEIIALTKDYDFDLVHLIGHDKLYRKDMGEKFFIIPVESETPGLTKYIKIATSDKMDHLYVAPYIYLKDQELPVEGDNTKTYKSVISAEHLNALYDRLIPQNIFDIKPDEMHVEFKHRCLKHLLSALLFKDLFRDITGQEDFDISKLSELSEFGVVPLMTELFGTANVLGDPECAYAKLINSSELSAAEKAINEVFGNKETDTVATADENKPTDDMEIIKKHLNNQIQQNLAEAYKIYVSKVGNQE